ncbi:MULTISPECIES: hypothetical protein [unclassified Mesorhizobium]|uniref:hypothetical protein n=1 Tax=unclassified Mesorhizobium TaxID=325217 RepID=UPI0016798642|nr:MULTISPECIES: hypothetical protein [unclassified Mesorhizobium]
MLRNAFLINIAVIGGLLLAGTYSSTGKSATKLCGNHCFRDRLTAAKRIRTVRATDLERLS